MSGDSSLPKFPRGSEWRKWDLQVHTPYSELNNRFGRDFDRYFARVLTAAVQMEIAAVGITDYFSIEGYKKFLELLRDKDKAEHLVGDRVLEAAEEILFLPNIEFRTSVIIRDQEGRDSRVAFHVILSNALHPEVIDEHFLRDLRFTAETSPGRTDEQWALTTRNLEELGKRLKSQHHQFEKYSDLFVGMMNAVVDHEDVTRVLETKRSIFENKYLFALPCDEDLSRVSWEGQGHLQRKLLIKKSHILSSSNPNTREFALGRRHPSVKQFLEEFNTLKPCVHSSDANSFEELFSPAEGRLTWIKVDPTFEGLRQILNEPEERVFIGPTPPGLMRMASRSTRIIRSLRIEKIPGSSLDEKWFDASLQFNPECVAVIGKKGSGKSALADVIGLLGNTPRHTSFSFLTTDRFREPKSSKAKHFRALLGWIDETMEGPMILDQNPPPESVEKVKYIPQHYLEEICNEIGLGKGSRFYSELQKVIFSHVPEAEKLGFGTLDDLLEHRSEEVHRTIEFLVTELRELNKQIVAILDRLAPQNYKAIDAQLAEKVRELDAHLRGRPKDVPMPAEDPKMQQQAESTSEVLRGVQAALQQIEMQINEARDADAGLAKKRAIGERLQGRIRNLERSVASALDEAQTDFTDLGLDARAIVDLKVNTFPLDEVLRTVDEHRIQISKQLDVKNPDGLVGKREILVAQVAMLENELSAPEREYQGYLQLLKEWEESKSRIIGNDQTFGSIKYLESQLAELKALPKLLQQLERRRRRKTLEIYREKQRLQRYYARYYRPVQDFLQEHPLTVAEWFKLEFDVSITQSGFGDAFLEFVDHRRIGAFSGVEEGNEVLRRLFAETNWDSPLSVSRFIRKLLKAMTNFEGRTLSVVEQLKHGISLQSLYDFVFSLRYLTPIYRLSWDGKGVEQLSPGERGNLLLIFYLLIDRNDVPLVIDQPEENLDNETVVRTLVPCMKDAKKRRQVFMVTHNPNLAVVCDAEQVIHAEIHKDLGNEVVYVAGSIEDPVINKRIVDVLEGTRPAFDKREAKYLPSD